MASPYLLWQFDPHIIVNYLFYALYGEGSISLFKVFIQALY